MTTLPWNSQKNAAKFSFNVREWYKNCNFYKKNNWLHNLPLITYKAVLTILLTIFFPKAVVFSHFARNWWKQKFCRNVSRKFFRTFHLSSAQVGCIFTASSKTFCQNAEIFLFNIRKWRNNEPSSAEFFYSKDLYDQVQRIFGNSAVKFFQEAKTFCPKEQKVKIKNFLKTFWQVFSEPSNVRLKTQSTVFTAPSKTFSRRPKVFRSISTIFEELNLLQQTFSTQNVPMITCNGIWTSSPKSFVQEAKNFRSREQKDKINNFFGLFWQAFSEPSNVRLKTQSTVFTAPSEVFSRRPKNFALCPKMMK